MEQKNAWSVFYAVLVGQGGFEPPTSPLSGVRSNQLSYRPGSNHQDQDEAYICQPGLARRPIALEG